MPIYLGRPCLDINEKNCGLGCLESKIVDSRLNILRQTNIILFVCLFVVLLYVPSQQLRSWRRWMVSSPNHNFFLGKLVQAVNQNLVHILSLVTDNNPS